MNETEKEEKEIERFQRDLPWETKEAKRLILRILKEVHPSSEGITGVIELERRVFKDLTIKRDRFGNIVYGKETFLPEHRTKPVHELAFIRAYKLLEMEGKIKIQRPPGIPFPMTDNQTIFSLTPWRRKGVAVPLVRL